jgi:hypothetical protein
MNDLVKGILGGGWSVVVGWIVPSAINVFVFAYLVYPALRSDAPFDAVAGVRPADRLLLMLGSSILFGLLFMSLQTPLYRLLEGYLWWPGWARNLGERRQRRRSIGSSSVSSRSGPTGSPTRRSLACP